jgi:hypothetical protein
MSTYAPIDHLVENIDDRLKKVDGGVYTKVEGLKELVEEYETFKRLVPESDTEKNTEVELYDDWTEKMSERDFRLAYLVGRIFRIDEALIGVDL